MGTTTLSAREQRWSDLGFETLSREYVAAVNDIATGMQGGEATRRYYRRYEMVQERVSTHESRDNGDVPACRAGCSYCCHNRVAARAHEVLTLADGIDRMPQARKAAVMERVARNAERIESMDGTEPFRTPLRCALLGDDDTCMAYEDRPSNCRRYHSLRVDDCKSSFFRPEDLTSRIRVSTPLLVASEAQAMSFGKVLSERGLDTAHYELHTALREALADPNACGERFSRGGRAFVHATRYEKDAPTP
jgi:Fe-S-cluster containining protein